ncbi:MAG: hypothetical protein Q9194_007279, partial [Teloschistes cf. exilis]
LSPRHIVRHPPVKRFSAVDSNRNSFVIHQLTAGITWGVRFYAYEAVEQTSRQVARAAEDLVAFYSATLALAKVVWAHDTPKSVRRAHWNGLSLIFWSDSPIPFDFVDAFLNHIVSDPTHPQPLCRRLRDVLCLFPRQYRCEGGSPGTLIMSRILDAEGA